jgi:N-acetylglucosamine-6-sulfatase
MTAKWTFTLGLGASLALLAGASAASAAQQSRPNILLMISDDHRWDALGAAGNRAVQTPALDSLARTGVWFRQATIHVPQCSPSRSTLLTGLAPHQHRWYGNQYQHPDVQNPDGFHGLATLPGLLAGAGYRTLIVGKWHGRPEPWNCGFSDVRTWLPGGSGPYLDPDLAHGRSRQSRPARGYTQEIFADDVIAFLNSPEATERPFFFWVAFTAPHGPYQPNPEHIRKLTRDKELAALQPPDFPVQKAADLESWRVYDEAVSTLDEQVGRVLKTLDDRKLAERTVVVFVGDNGFMMGDRGWHGKVVPYDGSVRVPMIVRAPGIATIQGPSEAPVSSLDISPTLLRCAGLEPPKSWPGRDLTRLLRSGADPGVDAAFCEWADDQSAEFGALAYRLVRTPRYKLLVWKDPKRPDELYDLQADPHERQNLISDEARASVRNELRSRLTDWMKRTNDPARLWPRGRDKDRAGP